MPTQMLRVFLSSTGKDLDSYRLALMSRVRASDHIIVVGMENFGARDDNPLDFCRDRVGKCDVFVGLIGHYRGWEVEGDNERRSITEIEFDCATEGKKPRLMYVAPDDFVVATPNEPPAAKNRQKKFRAEIRKGRVVGKGFTSPDQLAGDIIVDLMNLWAERLAAPIAAASAGTTPQAVAEAVVAAEKSASEGDTRFKQALELLQSNKPQEAEVLFRAVAEEKAARAQQEGKGAAAAFRHLGAIAGLRDPKRAREAYGRAIEFDPDDREALYWHGRLQSDAGNLALAERDLTRLEALSQHAKDERGVFRAALYVGDLRVARGDSPGAMKLFVRAREIGESNVAREADDREWQIDLSGSHDRIGDVLVAQGNLPAALTVYRDNLAIRERLAQSDPGNAGWQRDLSVSHNKIGDVLVAQGNLPAALTAYRDDLAIAERLAQSDPGNAEWQRDLSVSHDRIGNVMVAQGNLPAALTAYRDSLAIRERLVRSDPGNEDWQRDLSVSHNKVGDVLAAQGSSSAALTEYRDSLAVRERLAQFDPGNAGWQRDLSVSHDRIGNALVAQGNLSAALTAYRDSLAIRVSLVQSDSGNAGWQRDLSVSHNKIGDVLEAQGKVDAALKEFHEGLEISERLAQSDRGNVLWQADVLWLHSRLAQNGDDPDRRWALVVKALRQLKAEDKLTVEQANWLPEAERRLKDLAKKEQK